MSKVKVALTILTIVLTIGPFLGVVYVYRDNLVGLVMPPETPGQYSITNNDIANLNFTALENMQPIQPIGDPVFDQSTGVFTYDLNLTNPLPQELSLDNFSADIKTSDGQLLGTITIPDAIHINPGDSAVVDITGNIRMQTLNDYIDQYGDTAEISVGNINVTVGGITLHLDDIPGIGNIQLR